MTFKLCSEKIGAAHGSWASLSCESGVWNHCNKNEPTRYVAEQFLGVHPCLPNSGNQQLSLGGQVLGGTGLQVPQGGLQLGQLGQLGQNSLASGAGLQIGQQNATQLGGGLQLGQGLQQPGAAGLQQQQAQLGLGGGIQLGMNQLIALYLSIGQ